MAGSGDKDAEQFFTLFKGVIKKLIASSVIPKDHVAYRYPCIEELDLTTIVKRVLEGTGFLNNQLEIELINSIQYGEKLDITLCYCLLVNMRRLRTINMSVLEYAVRKKRPDLVDLLLRYPLETFFDEAVVSDPRLYEEERSDLLRLAFVLGNEQVTEKMLKSGFNIEDTDRKGESILSRELGEWNPRVWVVKGLLSAGSSVPVHGLHKCLYCDYSEKTKNKELAKLLIITGTDLNTLNFSDRTPLMVAAASHRLASVVKELLANGADFTLQDKDQKTALDRAVTCQNKEAIALLRGVFFAQKIA